MSDEFIWLFYDFKCGFHVILKMSRLFQISWYSGFFGYTRFFQMSLFIISWFSGISGCPQFFHISGLTWFSRISRYPRFFQIPRFVFLYKYYDFFPSFGMVRFFRMSRFFRRSQKTYNMDARWIWMSLWSLSLSSRGGLEIRKNVNIQNKTGHLKKSRWIANPEKC